MNRKAAYALVPAAVLAVGGYFAVGGDDNNTSNTRLKAAIVTQLPSLDTKVTGQTAKQLDVTWTPKLDGLGYYFYKDGKELSFTRDTTRKSNSFAIPDTNEHSYKIQAVGEVASDTLAVNKKPTTSTSTTTPTTSTTTTTIPTTTTTIPTTTTTPTTGVQVKISPTGNDATCTRNGSACTSLNKAYALAQPGDNIQAACGSYGYTVFNTRKLTGPNITFTPATPLCANLAQLDFTNGGDYVTIKGFNINDVDGAIYSGGSTIFSTGVTFDGNMINVGKRVDSQNINLHLVNGWKFINNTIGPSCCGVGANSPEGMRFGCAPCNFISKNVLIDNNIIQGTVRYCSFWLIGFGPCPSPLPTLRKIVLPPTPLANGKFKLAGGKLGDCQNCHADGIHIWGADHFTISNNKLIGVEVQGIFFEPTNASLNSNINIVGNTISIVGGNAGIYINAKGDGIYTSGTWNITDNVSTNLLEIGSGFSSTAPGTVFNLARNSMILDITNASGNAVGCKDSGPNTTINYSLNRWIKGSAGTPVPCPGD